MSGLRVLITNNTLAGRAGTELYVRDIALELLKRGHSPIAYSTMLGEVARELEKANVPVVDDLYNLAVVPDLIHGQQHMELMTALLHFSEVPAIQFVQITQRLQNPAAQFPSAHGRDRTVEHGEQTGVASAAGFDQIEIRLGRRI